MSNVERQLHLLLMAGLGAASLSRTGRDSLLGMLAARGERIYHRSTKGDGLLRHNPARPAGESEPPADPWSSAAAPVSCDAAADDIPDDAVLADTRDSTTSAPWLAFLASLSPAEKDALMRAIAFMEEPEVEHATE